MQSMAAESVALSRRDASSAVGHARRATEQRYQIASPHGLKAKDRGSECQ